MPKITSKGQITIPQEIRERFGFLPGTDVDVVAKEDRAFIVKSSAENRFLKWLGQGKRKNKQRIDLMVDKLRGRSDA
jgi:AbrB family looped-hinge helix DNA binding protein